MKAEARLDPWCVVAVVPGVEVLFGYAERHPATGGRSWMRSSPISHLDEAAGTATTASGRLYSLGRRTAPEAIEDEEAWVALELLIGRAGAGPADPSVVGSLGEWLSARKWARHCGVEPPPRNDPGAVRRFLAEHVEAYAARRGGARN
jgi:hypothetical protein